MSKTARVHVPQKIPEFANQMEELEFWRGKCDDKQKELEELEESFTDFQQSSKELEAEMERELTTNEKKLKDTSSLYHRLKSEHDEMMEKSRRIAEDSGKMIHNLQDELESLKKSNKDMRREKQRLEQDNDEMERRVREAEASLQDLTEKMNKTLEENSFLQTELEETKNRSQEAIQRMKDEIRDLKLELAIKNSQINDDLKPEPQPPKVQTMSSETKPEYTNHNLTQAPLATQRNGVTSPRYISKVRGSEGSIELVDDILLLVKDMEHKLISQKMEAESRASVSFDDEEY